MIRLAAALLAIAAVSAGAQGLDPLVEYRYIGAPVRLADGSILRRADVLAAFRKVHQCPSTMLFTGTCPGWQMNHVVPLACGGADAVWNLQWLPLSIKTGTNPHAVDRFERKINASTPPQPDTAACVNTVVP